MNTSVMVQTVDKYIKALCEHDISIIEEIFDINATIEDPAGSEPRTGMETIKGFYQYAFSKNVKAELTGSVRCVGKTAVFPFFITMDTDDSTMKLEPIDMFEFNDEGKIQSMKAYWGKENCS